MPVPTTEEIGTFLRTQIDLFNTGDIPGFMNSFKTIAPGGFRVEDPVGAPVQEGWEALETLCKTYQGWRLDLERANINGADAAIVVRNTGIYEGNPVEAYSIETYHFEPDGSLHVRYYHPNS